MPYMAWSGWCVQCWCHYLFETAGNSFCGEILRGVNCALCAWFRACWSDTRPTDFCCSYSRTEDRFLELQRRRKCCLWGLLRAHVEVLHRLSCDSVLAYWFACLFWFLLNQMSRANCWSTFFCCWWAEMWSVLSDSDWPMTLKPWVIFRLRSYLVKHCFLLRR